MAPVSMKILRWIWMWVKAIVLACWQIIEFSKRLVVNGVLVIVIGLVIGMMAVDSTPEIAPKTVLTINLSGNLVDDYSYGENEAAVRQLMSGVEPETRLYDILSSLKLAAEDKRIEAVFMKLDDLSGAGLASIRELGAAMDRFRKSGKRIVVWASSYTQRQYAIAAHASDVYLHPMGEVSLTGIGSARLYWGEALKAAGVTVHVFKAGDFKSFPEIFVRRGPSEESLRADRFWMDNAWAQLSESIQKSRGLLRGDVRHYIDTLPEALETVDGDMSRLALEKSLVDGVLTNDQVRLKLTELVGGKDPEKDLRQISLQRYLAAQMPQDNFTAGVGVITIEGEITDSVSEMGRVGAKTVVKLIDRARKDSRIKTLLLRVNSPGGSAVASEKIRRELELFRNAGKPIVVSMGDYAASGGYWVSTAGSQIVADPLTITGSIGVFGVMPTFEKTLEKLSIGTGGAQTTWLASASSPLQSMNPRVEKIMQLRVGRTYRDFIALVAEARNMTAAHVTDLAQGRVYTGDQALKNRLVDQMGGFLDAAKQARSLSKLPADAPLYWLQEDEKPVYGLLGKLLLRIRTEMLSFMNPLSALPVQAPVHQLSDMLTSADGQMKIQAHALVKAQF